jgi:hypothetical protein
VNELRRSSKNEKEFNPVIAIIILVAIAVLVSAATAIWMGDTMEQRATERARVSQITYGFISDEPENIIAVKFENVGIIKINITGTTINGTQKRFNITERQSIIKPGGEAIIIISDVGWISGFHYAVSIGTNRGNIFTKVTKAP